MGPEISCPIYFKQFWMLQNRTPFINTFKMEKVLKKAVS